MARKTKSKPKKSQQIHSRKRLQEKATKIAQNNSKLIAKNKYKFNVKELLNKGQLFDLNKTTEDQIMDKIMEGLPKDNDEFYINHTLGTNVFKVRKEI